MEKTKIINELKKRNCDINIKLTPSGTQYLHFEMDIQGDHLEFLPASTMGEQFGAIIKDITGSSLSALIKNNFADILKFMNLA